MNETRTAMAERLLRAYLARTGATVEAGVEPARRYLWTDACAVFTLVALHRRTGNPAHLADAERLVGLVHAALARHRPDDARRGWISGLGEAEGAQRPTAGGLRIGKPLPERMAGEPLQERLEWERDGQYFHYLVRWMLALDRLSRAAFEPRWNTMALELARRAHDAFLAPRIPGKPRSMYWKMSIDLSRPLVASMGHHDPLDGLAAAWRVQATRQDFGADDAELAELIQDYRLLCDGVASWSTRDALGIGGLLSSLGELIDLVATGRMPFDPLLLRIADDAGSSLAQWSPVRELGAPPGGRLAFREIGLAIGLRALPAMCEQVEEHPARFGETADRAILRASLESAVRHLDLAARIESAWIAPAAQSAPSWSMHEDINSVMLAASLLAGSDTPHARRLLRRLSTAP
jgi:hypothetical protein